MKHGSHTFPRYTQFTIINCLLSIDISLNSNLVIKLESERWPERSGNCLLWRRVRRLYFRAAEVIIRKEWVKSMMFIIVHLGEQLIVGWLTQLKQVETTTALQMSRNRILDFEVTSVDHVCRCAIIPDPLMILAEMSFNIDVWTRYFVQWECPSKKSTIANCIR
jgi:hypothetical protein